MLKKIFFLFSKAPKIESVIKKFNESTYFEKVFCEQLKENFIDKNNGNISCEIIESLLKKSIPLNSNAKNQQKDFQNIIEELNLSVVTKIERKTNDINENLKFLLRVIKETPDKLWPNLPEFSKFYTGIINQKLLDICLEMKKSQDKHLFSIFQKVNIYSMMIEILDQMLEKNTFRFKKEFIEFYHETFFSSEEKLSSPPNNILKIKAGLQILTLKNLEINEIFTYFAQNIESIIKNSKMSSIVKCLEFFNRNDYHYLIFISQRKIEQNLGLLSNEDLVLYLNFLFSYEKKNEESLKNVYEEINNRLISKKIERKKLQFLFDGLQNKKTDEKAKIFAKFLNKNFPLKFEEDFSPQKIWNNFKTENQWRFNKNFISNLQKESLPNYMINQDFKNIDFHHISLILKKIYEIKLLDMDYLIFLEQYFLKNKLKILDIASHDFISVFTILLNLLSQNGFLESELFRDFEEFFLKIKMPAKREKYCKNYIFIMKVTINSPYKCSTQFYEKLFATFHISDFFLLKNSDIRSISTFLRLISILWVSREEIKIKEILEKIVQSIYTEDFFEKLRLKTQKIAENFFQLINLKDEIIDLHDYSKIMQFFLTFQKNSPMISEYQNTIQEYFSICEKIDPKILAPTKSYKSNLEIDIIEILKSLQVKFKNEKKILIYSADIFIEPNIIVEILGRQHYSRNKKFSKPKDFLKPHHLKNLGYIYIEIPFYEFHGSFFTDFKWRKNYIKEKLGKYIPLKE